MPGQAVASQLRPEAQGWGRKPLGRIRTAKSGELLSMRPKVGATPPAKRAYDVAFTNIESCRWLPNDVTVPNDAIAQFAARQVFLICHLDS